MKFVVVLDPKTLKYDSFRYDEPGPLPPIVDVEEPEKARDGGAPEPGEEKSKKPKPS